MNRSGLEISLYLECGECVKPFQGLSSSLHNKAMVRGIYLSLDILQSITVFLLVFTIMKGRWIHALGGGAPHVFSTRLLRSTRFLKAICYKKANKKNSRVFKKMRLIIPNTTSYHIQLVKFLGEEGRRWFHGRKIFASRRNSILR